ncbi:unnamed protein product, partial [marine sediment metagenome]
FGAYAFFKWVLPTIRRRAPPKAPPEGWRKTYEY